MDKNPRYQVVRRTQVELFREAGYTGDDRGIVDLLDPILMIEHLGYKYEEWEEIPSGNPKYRTAGFLDRKKRRVVISLQFPIEQRRMTAMHEVVHLILHNHLGKERIHRDRPIDIADKSHSDPIEKEATEIASLCLMPELLVKKLFAETFCLSVESPIIVNEDTAFYLGNSIERLSAMDSRSISMALVTATNYGRPIEPIHRQFRVSPTSMAIRLEELNLIVPPVRRGTPTLKIVK